MKPNTVKVSRAEAADLCKAAGRRLCSEVEWERACKGPTNTGFEYAGNYDKKACEALASRMPGQRPKCESGFAVKDMHGLAFEWTDSAWGRATALCNSAEMHMVAGNEAAALDYAQRAQVIAEPTGNAYLLVHNTYRLAVLLANAGEYAAAQRYQRASLDYAEQLDYTSGIGMATASFGDIAFAHGDYAVAAPHFADALEFPPPAGHCMV